MDRFRQTDSSEVPRDSFPPIQAFEEQHYPVAYWAKIWGFSAKAVREWFRDEWGPGILRLSHTGRRNRRDYTTVTITPTAAARVYEIRTRNHPASRLRPEVMSTRESR